LRRKRKVMKRLIPFTMSIAVRGLRFACVLLGPLVFAVSASATATVQVVDDFNNGVYSGWTTREGTLSESGSVLAGTNYSLATYDSMAGRTIGVDAVGGVSTSYVAAVLNYSSLDDNLFVKIQDNSGNGLFDRVYFYRGNNGDSAVSGLDNVPLTFEVHATYFQVTDNGNGTVTATVSATGDTWTKTLTNTYAGTGGGLGFYGTAQVDNFYLAVPEPSTLTLLGVAALGLAGWAWRRCVACGITNERA
jgi:hypothetical protein